MDVVWLSWISPFVLMGVCRLTSLLTYRKSKPAWSWVPTVLVFWATMALFTWLGGGFSVLGATPHVTGLGSWLFMVLSLVIGFITLPILVGHWRVLSSKPIVIAWIAFAVINPWFEETYWRGLLINAVPNHSALWIGLMIAYSSVLFAYNHSVAFGRISPAMSDKGLLAATCTMGIIWSLGYVFTHSLWFAIVSHVLVDLGNLAVPVYMRLYLPPHLKTGMELPTHSI